MIYNDIGNGNNKEIDPITKYVKYGVFPMQLIVHLMLVVFTTFQVVLIVANDNNYSRAQERVMYNMFIDLSVDQTEVDYLKYKYLYTTNEVRQHVVQSVHNFFNLNATSFENVTYNNNTHIVMDITYKNKTVNTSYIISSNHYGLFSKDVQHVSSLLKTISYFTLQYTFTTYIPNTSYKQCNAMCTLWEVTQVYSFRNNAHCIVTLNINRLPCHVSQWYTIYMNSPLMWINIAVLFLALYSLRHVWTYISSMASLFIRVKMKHSHHQPYSDNSIYYNPLTDNPNEYQTLIHHNEHSPNRNNTSSIHFNKWEIICLLGNIIQLFASCICIIDIHHYMTCTELSIACGCFCAYLYLGRYIDYSKQYSAINMTILKSLPNVLRYLIGAVPVFMAFLFFGLCAFWKSERFASISSVIITLFSLANGDSIYDVLSDLSGIYFVLGQIYAYLFCIFFIVVVLNVFIAIVQEGYSRSQNETKNHWAYDEDNMQELKSCLALQKVNDEVQEGYQMELKDVKEKTDEQGNIKSNEDNNDNEIVRNVYNEITNIERCLNDIEVIAKNALKRGNGKLFEELRDNIFEFINEDVNTKLRSIKDILNDK